MASAAEPLKREAQGDEGTEFAVLQCGTEVMESPVPCFSTISSTTCEVDGCFSSYVRI